LLPFLHNSIEFSGYQNGVLGRLVFEWKLCLSVRDVDPRVDRSQSLKSLALTMDTETTSGLYTRWKTASQGNLQKQESTCVFSRLSFSFVFSVCRSSTIIEQICILIISLHHGDFDHILLHSLVYLCRLIESYACIFCALSWWMDQSLVLNAICNVSALLALAINALIYTWSLQRTSALRSYWLRYAMRLNTKSYVWLDAI
jgi:hypothetical protein